LTCFGISILAVLAVVMTIAHRGGKMDCQNPTW